MKEDQVYLKHIIEAAEKITSYIDGVSFDDFKADDLITDAVIRELEIIGEASGKVSEEFKNLHPEVFWPQMIGMRNRLIHEYFGVDKKVVWETCQTDLMDLDQQLRPLIS